MNDIIGRLGGPSAVANKLKIRPPSVVGWAGKPPLGRCTEIEHAFAGLVAVEELRPDVDWVRVPDVSWPHPGGRPCVDVGRRTAQRSLVATQEVRHAA